MSSKSFFKVKGQAYAAGIEGPGRDLKGASIAPNLLRRTTKLQDLVQH